MKIHFLLLILVLKVNSQKIKLNFNCGNLHALYDEGKHLVNLRRLYDNILRRNNVTLTWNEIGYKFFNSEFSHAINFNVSEEYLKAKVLTQTASLFYDQIKYKDYDTDVPSLFQNYSHCFLDIARVPKKLKSTHETYRLISGYGNNLKYPRRGESFTSFGRFLKAQYDDNIHAIRKSGRGYELPSPRNIVRKLFLNDRKNLNKFMNLEEIPNVASIMFAQFLANDIGSRQIGQSVDGSDDGAVRCCAHFNQFQLPQSLMHSSCLPIIISRSDPFYSPHNIKCMAFVRSQIISNNPYRIEIGEQVNGVTSYLDLSQIYGSSYDRLKRIRSLNGGRLKMDIKNILPIENGNYFSGDDRAMQSPFLAIFHSLFTRSHNNIADKLGALNRHWSDEKLFHEARKINIGIYQKIIYEEFLKIFLTQESWEKFENSSYDVEVDATTMNEFSSAAFRIFHSFIPSNYEIRHENVEEPIKLNFSDILTKTDLLMHYESILRGMMHQKMGLTGYSNEVLNKMFKNPKNIGLDLLSMDVLRGRDHGIPPYHKFRKMCNVKPYNLKVFNDLAPALPQKVIIQLRQTYKAVYDIDLLVGGALEKVENSAFFGPTFQCLIAEQFYRLKSGDFYFYTHNSTFTADQLEVIRKYSFANLICENSNLNEVTENIFKASEEKISCSEFSKIDLSLWQEYYESEEE